MRAQQRRPLLFPPLSPQIPPYVLSAFFSGSGLGGGGRESNYSGFSYSRPHPHLKFSWFRFSSQRAVYGLGLLVELMFALAVRLAEEDACLVRTPPGFSAPLARLVLVP